MTEAFSPLSAGATPQLLYVGPPIPMVLHCPECGLQHIDAPEPGEFISSGPNAGRVRAGWSNPPHRSHLCHGCGYVWRPADVPTVGVPCVATKGTNDSEPRQGMHHKLVVLQAEADRLRGLINTPHVDNFMDAVRLEAAHQQERWGTDHDEGKAPADWFWLLGHLAGKSVAAFAAGNRAKGLHHIISSAAALLNWHRHAIGEPSRMRPGITPPKELEQQ